MMCQIGLILHSGCLFCQVKFNVLLTKCVK
ncbi:hypothetical protein ACJIZ3_003280 [Penstemon smallii]|uniref:Uncharacterized protein n=1 Tax=Penstemon smallii TaxID=265156 RepID=A0ABD3UA06_9LAMI